MCWIDEEEGEGFLKGGGERKRGLRDRRRVRERLRRIRELRGWFKREERGFREREAMDGI